ncbi:MAG: hypothetical protein KatS3mg021_0613 [Fimbriimonadales bacterium]|jgi:hypothetical protein|nr:MAG: hypothetical protein KatS3mg021_0613 [Fimbriimonadales bacterium]
MKYVLGTDILIDVLRGYEPAVEWLATLAEQPVVVSLSVMELVQGCRNRQELGVVGQLGALLEIWYPGEAEMQAALRLFQANCLRCRLSMIDAVIGSACVAR